MPVDKKLNSDLVAAMRKLSDDIASIAKLVDKLALSPRKAKSKVECPCVTEIDVDDSMIDVDELEQTRGLAFAMRNPRRKMQHCSNWLMGECKYGKGCTFIHTKKDSPKKESKKDSPKKESKKNKE